MFTLGLIPSKKRDNLHTTNIKETFYRVYQHKILFSIMSILYQLEPMMWDRSYYKTETKKIDSIWTGQWEQRCIYSISTTLTSMIWYIWYTQSIPKGLFVLVTSIERQLSLSSPFSSLLFFSRIRKYFRLFKVLDVNRSTSGSSRQPHSRSSFRSSEF